MSFSTFLFVAAVGLFTLVAAVCDWKTKRLPNWLTVPGLAAALVYHGINGGMSGLLWAAGGFATGFGLLLVLWLIGSSGAGDVKLMGALGAWLGSQWTLYVVVLSAAFVALSGIVVLMVQMVRRGSGYVQRRYLTALDTARLPRDERKAAELRQGWHRHRRVLPYAVPVALGSWVLLALKLVLNQT